MAGVRKPFTLSEGYLRSHLTQFASILSVLLADTGHPSHNERPLLSPSSPFFGEATVLTIGSGLAPISTVQTKS